MADIDLDPAAEAPSAPGYAQLQGVGRAFAVLEALAGGPMRPAELARDLGMKWTTTYRTLTFLTKSGYVERDDVEGHYALGVRAYALGSAYLMSEPVAAVSRPYLDATAAATGATVQLVKRDDERSVVLSVFEGRRDHVPDTTVGCNFPLHCGSKGHVLLAYADDAFVDEYLSRPLVRMTRLTITDPGELRARFERIRECGHAMTDRDVRLYSSSVAAPVFDRSGNAAAAITLIVRPDELREEHRRLVDVATRTASAITAGLRRATAGHATRYAELHTQLSERYAV